MERDLPVKKVAIREYDGERDLELIEKFEKHIEIGSRRGLSILTNMMGDPLCRVRLYPDHIMLVAELVGESMLVGVIRGCIKCVRTGQGAANVTMGCILGLRVSSNHRRMGIGTKLVKSVEEWATQNGVQHLFLATEDSNTASTNLFMHKCNYTRLTSLTIIIQPFDIKTKNKKKKKKKKNQNPSTNNIRIEKLSIERAISLYKDRLGGNKLFPHDIDSIFKQQLSLGTWVAYFNEEHWSSGVEDDDGEFLGNAPSSWAVVSIWKTCESYKLQIRGAPLLRCFHAILSHLPCLEVFPSFDLLSGTLFGFLFLYGLYGEGERVGELMKCLWSFACDLGECLKDCKAVVTEVGVGDPMMDHVPWGSSTSRMDDVWFLKKVAGSGSSKGNELDMVQPLSCVFVDPRDF